MRVSHAVPVQLVDFTARKQLEDSLRLSPVAVEYSFDAVVMLDARGRIVSVNPAFTQIFAYGSKQAIGKALARLLQGTDGRDDKNLFRRVSQSVALRGQWEGELTCTSSTGDHIPVLLRLSAIRNADNAITNYIGVIRDNSERKANEQRLKRLALHDALTGLATRTLLIERGNQAMLKAERHSTGVAVLLVDLNRFALVNQRYGREVGDELLKLVGAQLGSCVRAYDTVARWGGDEFVILLSEVKGVEDSHIVVEKVMQEFARPFFVNGHELNISASVGAACFPEHGLDMAALLDAAEESLYDIKQSGCIVAPFMREQNRR